MFGRMHARISKRPTPTWFLPWGKRDCAVDEDMDGMAAYLYDRATRYKDVLHLPDAWVCPWSRRLVFRQDEATDKYLPLAIGDCLEYTQVLSMPFVTHDMIYVGLGCVVGFQREGSGKEGQHSKSAGCIQIDSLDVIKVAGKRLFLRADGGRTLLTRIDVAQRALLSIGWYDYGSVTFNCQHAYELILGNQHFSLGMIRMTVVFGPCAFIAVIITLLLILSHIKVRA